MAGRCHICFSIGLGKVETGFNPFGWVKRTSQMLNCSYSHWFAGGLRFKTDKLTSVFYASHGAVIDLEFRRKLYIKLGSERA